MVEFGCDICQESFVYSEVLEAHKTGHAKADKYLYEFYLAKIKPTESDPVKPKKLHKKVFKQKVCMWW